MKKILLLAICFFMLNCSPNKKKFHNSDFTRKRVNGIYKYYSRYDK